MTAFGAEWSMIPAFQTRGQFTDNLLLNSGPHSAVWGSWLNPSVRMQYATEIFSLHTHPEFEYVQYFSHDENSDKTFTNFFLPFSGSYTTEVDRFGLDVSFNRDNSLIRELEETGVVTAFIQRFRTNVHGQWDHLLTERLTLETSYQYNSINYENEENSRLFDFQTHTGTFGPSYQWTEETRVFSNVWYSNSHFSDVGFLSQSTGVELGFSHRLFETFTITSGGGGRYVKTASQTNGLKRKNNSLVWLFNLSLLQEWERTQMTAGFSRSLNPSGFGVLLKTDRVDVGALHRLTEKIIMSLNGSLTMNDTVGSSSGGNRITNTRYWRVEPAVSWRLREDWSLRFSYSYAQRNVPGSLNQTARANAVNLALTYTWPKWSVSR